MSIKRMIIVLVICQIFQLAFRASHTKNKIIIFDVGQGDSIMIDFDNKKVIIDGGSNWDLDQYLENMFIFPFCKLEMMFVTHPQYDHITGLKRMLERCNVNNVVFNVVPYKSNTYHDFLVKLETYSKTNKVGQFDQKVVEGDTYEFGEMKLITLWPTERFISTLKKSENINNISTVLFLDYKDYEAIFTGDIEEKALNRVNFDSVIKYIDGPLDLYKVSHHGAINGLSKKVLLQLKPQTCVISVGKDNRYNHPDPVVLDFLSQINCEVRRTDLEGTIEFELH